MHAILYSSICSADGAGELPEGIIRDAFDFLKQQGCINMGVPSGEPDLVKEAVEQAEAFPTEDDIIRGLQDILKDADLQVYRPLHLRSTALLMNKMTTMRRNLYQAKISHVGFLSPGDSEQDV